MKRRIIRKWWLLLVIAILATGMLCSCGKQSSETKTLDVSLSVEQVNVDSKTAFKISTNLPDGTVLMLTLKNEAENYTGQTKATVEGGSAESEGFGKNGGALPSGNYILSISMSLPKLQSEAVQKIIGSKGENLSGQYVKKDGTTNSNYVSGEFEFAL